MRTFVTLLFIILSFSSNAELSCSANGLKVIYINGVWVEPNENKDSTDHVNNVLKPIQSQLDKSNQAQIIGVHNASRLLSNDLEELKAQLAANHNGQKRTDYWKAMARNKFSLSESYLTTIDAALTQIANKEKTYDKDGNFIANQNAYSESDLYQDIAVYNKGLANLLANAASDVAVVESLKLKIKEAYNNGSNKLIVIAHSQGNEVLYSAIKDLRSEPNFLKTDSDVLKFDGLVGYMQVAPPSPKLVTNMPEKINYYSVDDPASPYANHAQYIRHSSDGIIGMSYAQTGVMPLPSNYTSAGLDLKIQAPTLKVEIDQFFAKLSNSYGTSALSILYHGMDDVYLSSMHMATRDSNSTQPPKSFLDHFKDNMREIASKLQDNCLKFAINPTTTDNKTFTFTAYVLSGNAPTAYEWNFGDGSIVTTTQNVVTHTFNSTTNKIFTVTAKGLDGSSTPSIATTIASVIIPEVYHYELWVLCQTSPKNLCYYEYSCTPEQRADETLVYTGLNYPSVYIFDHNNVVVGVQREPEVSAPFVDSIYDRNDPTKQRRIEFTIGNSCPQGREISEQAREFFVESLQ